MSDNRLFGAMSKVLKPIAEAMSGFAESFMRMMTGGPTVQQGYEATASHDETGRFDGHICECLTEHSVTVARASDGVLIQIPRDALVRTNRRKES